MFNKIYLITIIIIIAASCRKEDHMDIQPSVDYMLIQNNLARVVPLVIHTAENQLRLNRIFADSLDTLNSCANYFYLSGDTTDIANQDIQFKIVFDMCKDEDSDILKNGTVICQINNYMNTDGAVCRISFDNFSLDGNQLEGVIFVVKQPGNEYTLQTLDLFQRVGIQRILYDGNMSYNFSHGTEVEEIKDDVLFSLDNGVLKDRFDNTSDINNPGMRKLLNCAFFTSGIVEIVNEKNVTQVLEIGDGNCNNQVEITFEEESFSIEL